MARTKHSNYKRDKGNDGGDDDRDWLPPKKRTSWRGKPQSPRKKGKGKAKAKGNRTAKEQKEIDDRRSNKGMKLNQWTPQEMKRALDL